MKDEIHTLNDVLNLQEVPEGKYRWCRSCDNCQELYYVYVPLGTKTSDFKMKPHKCLKCGCLTK